MNAAEMNVKVSPVLKMQAASDWFPGEPCAAAEHSKEESKHG